MIEIATQLPNPEKIVAYLEGSIKSHLVPDVSSYAKGRLKTWLGTEPSLTSPTKLTRGTAVDAKVLTRLAELIGWQFDFCLVTYSGDNEAIGISPHRDASYADFEAMGLHLSGECKFEYWMGRQTFGRGPNLKEFDPKVDEPTHSLLLVPGQLVRFNCKNLHAASPGEKRWNINFWRKKT